MLYEFTKGLCTALYTILVVINITKKSPLHTVSLSPPFLFYFQLAFDPHTKMGFCACEKLLASPQKGLK
jgi:hypothetical protein